MTFQREYNTSWFWPHKTMTVDVALLFFFFFCLLFSCGSFVFYDVGFGQRQKKKMLLPKENVRKRSIIIINEFSAHNTFYSLFKWISLSCRQVLLLWGCCYYPGFFLSNWLPYFNEPVKLLAQLWKEANRYSQNGKWPQIDKEMLTFCCFLVNIYTFPFDLIPFGLLCLPKCYSRVMIADLEFLWKYFGYEMTTKGF